MRQHRETTRRAQQERVSKVVREGTARQQEKAGEMMREGQRDDDRDGAEGAGKMVWGASERDGAGRCQDVERASEMVQRGSKQDGAGRHRDVKRASETGR